MHETWSTTTPTDTTTATTTKTTHYNRQSINYFIIINSMLAIHQSLSCYDVINANQPTTTINHESDQDDGVGVLKLRFTCVFVSATAARHSPSKPHSTTIGSFGFPAAEWMTY